MRVQMKHLHVGGILERTRSLVALGRLSLVLALMPIGSCHGHLAQRSQEPVRIVQLANEGRMATVALPSGAITISLNYEGDGDIERLEVALDSRWRCRNSLVGVGLSTAERLQVWETVACMETGDFSASIACRVDNADLYEKKLNQVGLSYSDFITVDHPREVRILVKGKEREKVFTRCYAVVYEANGAQLIKYEERESLP